MIISLQQRSRGRQEGHQESIPRPSEGCHWSYRWSSNNAIGNPLPQVSPFQQQQGQPFSFPDLAGSAPHQNQPPTSSCPEHPLPSRNQTQQIPPYTQTPPSHNHPHPPHTPTHSHRHSKATCPTLHNHPRSAHKISPLQWSEILHHDAQQYTERLARKGRMEHSSSLGEKGQGENLYASSDRKAGFKQAIGAWMGEERHYRPGAKVDGGGEMGRWAHYCEAFLFSFFGFCFSLPFQWFLPG